ncbi:ATP-binding protein [Hahella sp. CR1]|uniref:ATP-binding protein n=1 Tax=Hahella sp. CR1 TaxID=2992807 RepID=UPI0024428C94|nr:ATP-binding protein [Hahella sp. CR1]MDG9669622.1 ATP-binding protein [Hahella sp. CR1]
MEAGENEKKEHSCHFSYAMMAVAYFILSIFCILISRESNGVASIWLSNAFGFVVLIRTQTKRWVYSLILIFIAGVAANMIYGDDLVFASLLMVANVTEIFFGALIVKSFLTKSEDYSGAVYYIYVTIIYTALASFIGGGIGALIVSNYYDTNFLLTLKGWWIGDAIGGFMIISLGVSIPDNSLRKSINLSSFLLRLIGSLFASYSALYLFDFPFVIVALVLIACNFGTSVFETSLVSNLVIVFLGVALIFSDGVIPVSYSVDLVQQFWISAATSCLTPVIVMFLLSHTKEKDRQANYSDVLFKHVFNFAATGLAISDEEGKLLKVNDNLLKMLCYSNEELIGRSMNEITYFEDVKPSYEQKGRLFNNPSKLSVIKKRLLRKNGDFFWVKVKSVVMDMDGSRQIIDQVEDITASKRWEDEIKVLTERLTTAANSIGIGIWDWNIKTNDLYWDAKMYKIYGVDSSKSSDNYAMWKSRVHPEDLNCAEQLLSSAVKNRDKYDTVFRIILDNGEIRDIKAAGLIIQGEEGEPERMVGMNWDISELKRIERELSLAKGQAEAANKAKSNFLANMSHEIRTPMNAVLGLSKVLSHTDLSPIQKKYLNMIEKAGRSLLSLLNDILDFSKIEANKLELNEVEFDINETISAVSYAVFSSVRNEDIECFIDLQEGLDITLIGDSLRLEQILINLAGNSVKFTHSGTVSLSVRELQRDNETITLKFLVTDSGIGMTPEQMSSLFSAFQQADATTTREYGGSGLGLAITKRLVTMMGGDITVESEVDKGSQFSFYIPFKYKFPVNEKKYTDTCCGFSVLFLAGFSVVNSYVERLIKTWGGEVSKNSDFESLIKMSEAYPSKRNILIIDYKAVDLYPSDTLAYLQEKITDSNIKVIFLLSPHQYRELSLKFSKINFDMVYKPVLGPALREAIIRLDSDEERKDANKKVDKINFTGKQLLLVEDNEFNRLVVQGMLGGLGVSIDVAENGRQAVDIIRNNPNGYDLILMDVQMPVMDGREASKIIKSELGVDIPIIALTAGMMAWEKELCYQARMNEVLGKPIEYEEFVSVLSKYLGSEINIKDIYENKVTSGETVTLNTEKLDGLIKVSGCQATGLITMVKDFCRKWPAEIEDVGKKILSEQWDEAYRILHTMKGVSGTVGVEAFSTSVANLEIAVRERSPALVDAGLSAVKAELNKASKELEAWAEGVSLDTGEEGTFELGEIKIEEFVTMIRTNNMSAYDIYSNLRAGLKDKLTSSSISELDEAFASLDFERALTIMLRSGLI